MTSVSTDPTQTWTTISGVPIEPLYTEHDLTDWDPATQLGHPGQFPFTRGIHESMFRGRLWTMRQFAGFGRPSDTNRRFRFLLDQGQTGLSTAFDLPTLMGLDSDDPRSLGEVGRLGVAIDTVDDMLALFDGIDLTQVSVSMTINAPAIVVMSFYLSAAKQRGDDWRRLRGTIQNDILKEFHAQNEYVFPPAPSVGLVVDLVEFCSQHVPQWNTVSISGYHIREAGSTAAQELAFTLADGEHYVQQCLSRGLDIDSFAPRLSFFFNAHNDLFEEVAKYRAARVLWAEMMRDRYGAKSPASWKLRFHAQTAGCSLQATQPELNLVRVGYQALAAALGGCQSLHTNSMDETFALPSEHAATLALRTQQVLAYETGVTNTVDPVGGSYFVETLTQQMQTAANDYFAEITEQGGMIPAVENGFFRREIAEAAFAYQQAVDSQRKIVVGVNDFQQSGDADISLMQFDESTEAEQITNLKNTKAARSGQDVARSLALLKNAAASGENVFPALLQCADHRVTVQECMDAMADVYGRFRPTVNC
ncbi:methylmalonyl-CoA mutase, large subunit [Rhodopirellula maiorica SM1]|uniref:Methylmalonyl-CoA mutase, large subunit n=1 Tax=Rhodopirellula maiorica SM1 TaxID=1265738 RepID=M5RNP6_9BACT|nr:methylmalonyl-CoA mutase family protein [Rhodopirellula maiorica]EMI20806.1 methylmalonyl-CoA mutase, large subunit [Rhodopirellula maiorica SM1]